MKTIKDKQLLVGADFAGFPLKEAVVAHLKRKGWTITDVGVRTDSDPNDTDQMDMRTLWNTDTDRARAELNWRITLVFTVFMMALMVVPLSVVNPRQGRVLSMLPAMLLYLLFFLIQTSLKSNGGKGKLDPTLWMWTVNLIYLALAIVLNLWDTVPVRRLRASFSRKGAV